jgi:hypothetical protein
MTFPFGAADFALVGVVTAMATAMAYVHSPRAKSLIFCLPLPFTAGVIASGQPVGITHVVGVALVAVFPWLVWMLHTRWGLNIVLADLITVGAVLGAGFLLARLLPTGGPSEALAFWIAVVVLGLLAIVMLALPPRAEPGHRSALPIYFKVPAIAAIVLGIVLVKEPLRGFMPTFPFATIFAVYESRRSLYTLAWRMPIMTLGFVPMLVACRLLQAGHGYPLALACGWAGFVPIALLLDRHYARRAVDKQGTVDAVDKVDVVDTKG